MIYDVLTEIIAIYFYCENSEEHQFTLNVVHSSAIRSINETACVTAKTAANVISSFIFFPILQTKKQKWTSWNNRIFRNCATSNKLNRKISFRQRRNCYKQ